jgi:hypothetical protein
MTRIPTNSSASALIAKEEKHLPPLPETASQALYFLEGAALYLEESYFDSECKRNEGWGWNEAQRQAYSILTHKSSELILEGQTVIWTPNSEGTKP